jgi:hypothetical protein
VLIVEEKLTTRRRGREDWRLGRYLWREISKGGSLPSLRVFLLPGQGWEQGQGQGQGQGPGASKKGKRSQRKGLKGLKGEVGRISVRCLLVEGLAHEVESFFSSLLRLRFLPPKSSRS